MTKITPADIAAARLYEPHLYTCPLYNNPVDWRDGTYARRVCNCDPQHRLAAAFAAHRLTYGGEA